MNKLLSREELRKSCGRKLSSVPKLKVEMWGCGDLEMWEHENLGMWERGDVGIWEHGVTGTWKLGKGACAALVRRVRDGR